ncbi:hypothetical protein RRG08_037436 [Elysia crispata]|uniref:Uncharacterized protein n=1 Tax=Elysia crispata TaxID=231223 RepID=A0AAE0Y563_9GAST|nr:hypothetical protein RRG08_037436 [Elysia crispata]
MRCLVIYISGACWVVPDSQDLVTWWVGNFYMKFLMLRIRHSSSLYSVLSNTRMILDPGYDLHTAVALHSWPQLTPITACPHPFENRSRCSKVPGPKTASVIGLLREAPGWTRSRGRRYDRSVATPASQRWRFP